METEPNKLYLVDDSGKLIVEKQPHIRLSLMALKISMYTLMENKKQ
ncbi:hypothetical protein [Liquorilactobacillus nagelii]|jgi:hypothetical protein|nr:hypothetical protein [Liquorilactobacillus nagelii]MCI1700006.1 hypothetical protein [Liquorilactobacillus nagelii]